MLYKLITFLIGLIVIGILTGLLLWLDTLAVLIYIGTLIIIFFILAGCYLVGEMILEYFGW